VEIGDREQDITMPDSGIDEPCEQEWDHIRSQKIGPLEWDGGDYEPYYIPVTAGLLQEWAEAHKCVPESVRVEMYPRAYTLEQIIRGTMREI